MTYLLIKWIHILSATILFGTGIGSAFYMFMANRHKEIVGIYFATRHVVIADWLFTTPAIVIQFATGVWLTHLLGYSLQQSWITLSLVLYFVVGVCWLPVVWIQMKMRDMAKVTLEKNIALSKRY